MADAGFRLSVEGEKEFRKAISDINEILKLNQAELKRSVAEYNASDKDIDALTKRHKELEDAISTQMGAISEMSGELTTLRDRYGENDKGVIKMQASVDSAAASLASMQKEMQEVEAQMKSAEAASDKYGESVDDIDARIKAFAAEIRAADTVIEGNSETLSLFGKSAEQTEKQVADLQKKSELLTGEITEQKKKIDLLNDEMQEAVKLYGSQSREVADYRVQVANATTELSKMEKELEDNEEAIKKAESGAIDLQDVFGKISEITGVQIPERLTGLIKDIDKTSVAAAGFVAVLAEGVKKINEMQTEARKLSADIVSSEIETGLDVEQLQVLEYIAKKYGVEVNALKDSLKDLRNNMYDAANGSGELSEAFAKTGVEIFDENGQLRNVLEVYKDLSTAFQNVTNDVERLALMEDILGESVNQTAQVAMLGRETLERATKEAYENWGIYSEKTIYQWNQQEQAVRDYELAIEGAGRQTNAYFKELFRLWSEVAYSDGNLFEKIRDIIVAMSDAGLNSRKNSLVGGMWAEYPAYAAGTYNHPGGYALVGERGPEIVDLPAGSRVYPNGEGVAAGTVNYYNVTIPASDIREFNDIVRIAQSKRVTERMK